MLELRLGGYTQRRAALLAAWREQGRGRRFTRPPTESALVVRAGRHKPDIGLPPPDFTAVRVTSRTPPTEPAPGVIGAIYGVSRAAREENTSHTMRRRAGGGCRPGLRAIGCGRAASAPDPAARRGQHDHRPRLRALPGERRLCRSGAELLRPAGRLRALALPRRAARAAAGAGRRGGAQRDARSGRHDRARSGRRAACLRQRAGRADHRGAARPRDRGRAGRGAAVPDGDPPPGRRGAAIGSAGTGVPPDGRRHAPRLRDAGGAPGRGRRAPTRAAGLAPGLRERDQRGHPARHTEPVPHAHRLRRHAGPADRSVDAGGHRRGHHPGGEGRGRVGRQRAGLRGPRPPAGGEVRAAACGRDLRRRPAHS